jgi:hypothetical protein
LSLDGRSHALLVAVHLCSLLYHYCWLISYPLRCPPRAENQHNSGAGSQCLPRWRCSGMAVACFPQMQSFDVELILSLGYQDKWSTNKHSKVVGKNSTYSIFYLSSPSYIRVPTPCLTVYLPLVTVPWLTCLSPLGHSRKLATGSIDWTTREPFGFQI